MRKFMIVGAITAGTFLMSVEDDLCLILMGACLWLCGSIWFAMTKGE